MGKMNKKLGLLAAAAAVSLGLYFAGPRVRIDHQRRELDLPEDLDQYLALSEARVPGVIPNTEKKITWVHPEKTKTPLALVYLHGFSASRQETAPLSEELAAELGANLFCTRLSGHGLSQHPMAECTVSDWLNDTLDSLEIGRRLGERIIVLGVSTGGTLATWLAAQPDAAQLLAVILISPNFAPKNPLSETFTWPWAQQLLPRLLGTQYGWQPGNPQIAQYWSHRYPTRALFQMMALVKHVRNLKLQQVTKPLLCIYSPFDQVVNANETRRQFARFGSPLKEILRLDQYINADNHVIAGSLLAPDNTAPLKTTILEFIRRL